MVVSPAESTSTPNRQPAAGIRNSFSMPSYTDVVKDRSPAPAQAPRPVKIETRGLNFYYGDRQALFDISLAIAERSVTAFIGPSGCGKSTFLRTLNRMNDIIEGTKHTGEVLLEGVDIFAPQIDVVALRKRVGMVFQKSTPFPKSIFDNIAYGPRVAGERDRRKLTAIVESSLQRAGLWAEVKDRMNSSALALSGGQQQRLCIARAIAAEPEVLLMDEPCSALDPIATGKIEDLIWQLKGTYSVMIVTHNMHQASRCSDYTAFLYLGRLIEHGPTEAIFTKPLAGETEDYVSGRFG